ncbi:hypothetical protein EPUL_000901 [Erysiphe pulchra]|uniref:Endonuclease/exonuclease/phosphatase domain-containing protein n=1 Tax=Erysiphe pulchra TaxID=225359 RepID=A0A2S4PW31_9PEZI|nr:hypothetical protein EPUL_000901 [Erysiphe pulchra]
MVILGPTSAKAAAIVKAKSANENRFRNATVERQETWITFVDGLLQQELAFIHNTVSIREMSWKRRSKNDEPHGYIQICVPEPKAPSSLLPIWNINNAPIGSDEAECGKDKLLSYMESPFIISGDFNLRHPLWDSTVVHPRSNCDSLIKWYGSNFLKRLNPIKSQTHNQGGTLDRAFCTDMSANYEVRTDLHTTSDHETLVYSLYWSHRAQSDSNFQYKAFDNGGFLKL